jgi:hypothetical protein
LPLGPLGYLTLVPYTFTNDMPRLRRAMDTATSLLNQRLWDLRLVAEDRVELYSLPEPTLGKLLPREVVISCGAALYNLRLAIEVAGWEPTVWPLPNLDLESGLLARMTTEPTLLASVEVVLPRAAQSNIAEQEMYEAMWLRRTNRLPDQQLPVPLPILVEMENAAAHERAWLRILNGRQRRAVLRAVQQASRDPLVQRLAVLSAGVAADNGSAPDKQPPISRPDFWRTDELGDFRHMQILSLATDDDRPLDWLRAGEALQHALLNGTRFSMSALGGRSTHFRQQLEYGPLDPHRLRPRAPVPAGYAVEASFLTQFLELADLKAQLAELKAPAGVDLNSLELADLEGLELADPRDRQRQQDGGLRWPWRTYYTEIPQVVMRIGYAPAESGTGPGDSHPEPAARPVADDQPAAPFPPPGEG